MFVITAWKNSTNQLFSCQKQLPILCQSINGLAVAALNHSDWWNGSTRCYNYWMMWNPSCLNPRETPRMQQLFTHQHEMCSRFDVPWEIRTNWFVESKRKNERRKTRVWRTHKSLIGEMFVLRANYEKDTCCKPCESAVSLSTAASTRLSARKHKDRQKFAYKMKPMDLLRLEKDRIYMQGFHSQTSTAKLTVVLFACQIANSNNNWLVSS